MKSDKFFGLLMVATVLFGCNLNREPVYDFRSAPALLPLSEPDIVLNKENAEETAEIFTWVKGDYGFSAAPIYVLEVDNTEEFPDPVSLGETSKLELPVTVGKLNNATIILGGDPGKTIPLFLRLQVRLTSSEVVYSAPVPLTVTPYESEIEFPRLYVPGSYQGWDIANAPYLTSLRMNNKFEGYLNMVMPDNPAGAVTFKLTTEPAWGKGTEYGSAGSPGKLQEKGGDISLSPQGYYLLKVNLNDLTYEAIPANEFWVAGSAVSLGNENGKLHWDAVEHVWTGLADMVPGTFRFRLNNREDISYGDGDANGKVDTRANNDIVVIEAGRYRIKFYTEETPYRYVLNKE